MNQKYYVVISDDNGALTVNVITQDKLAAHLAEWLEHEKYSVVCVTKL